MTNDDTYVGYSGVGQMAISNGTVQTSYLSTGEFGQGTLTVAGGTLNLLAPLSSGLYVGHFADSTGTVWVTGGQVFVTNDFTTIGSDGAGTMVVSNGTVRTSDMLVGEYAAGTLTVAGGTVSFSSVFTTNFTLGFFQSSSGTVWVTGGQLLASNVSTVIGISGAATLTVSNGTMRARDVVVGSDDGSQGNWVVAGGTNILSSFLTLGEFPGATGNVWVGGGLFVVTNAPPMIVGSNGVGFVTVTNGVVRARTMLLGNQTGSSGTLSVMGGATTVLSNLVAGNCGLGVPGIVNVSGGGLFVTNAPKTAFLDVRSGTLTQSGGALIVDRLVMTNVCGRFIRTGGTLTIGSTNMSANLSAVGDGIPNSWKLQYGFDLFDPTVADADPDGDGMSNLEEFLAGTVPTNSASALRITSITSEGDNVRITWTMGAGRTNALQRTPGAASGDYATNFADIFVVTNSIGSVTNYLDVGAATNDPAYYYRVRVVP